MPEPSLVFVSKSREKFEEYQALLGLPGLRWSQASLREIQSSSLELLVEDKIEQIRPQLPEARFFVEHTGLIIHAWKGLPGGLTSVFMETVGNGGICKMMRGYRGVERRATARVVIGYYHPVHGKSFFHGEVVGSVADDPRGANQFGWDPIFIPEGDSRTYGEMPLEEKNRTSMRKDAALKLRRHLAHEPPAGPARVFVSYAHEDLALWKELRTHLKSLELRGLVSIRTDRDIPAGADWKRWIQEQLDTADVVLLLVSPDFIASEFCREVELRRALARHEAGDALVVPIILRAASWEMLPFAKLQALPRGGVPVARWPDRDAAFADVVRGLEAALAERT